MQQRVEFEQYLTTCQSSDRADRTVITPHSWFPPLLSDHGLVKQIVSPHTPFIVIVIFVEISKQELISCCQLKFILITMANATAGGV